LKIVSFISIDDEPPDLILSFAIWNPEWEDISSLILMRTPKFEPFLSESERGVTVSYEAWKYDHEEELKSVEFHNNEITIISSEHRFELDLRKIDKEDIKDAKEILNRMNFDNRFKLETN